ncbi:MAG: hypothetical protein ACT4N8_04600 [Sphingosinicella sp.]|uniref:hypothetical protein n=1 Tax=Sphingosinicella sp. TaxID=1917971 RepID=UPI004037C350
MVRLWAISALLLVGCVSQQARYRPPLPLNHPVMRAALDSAASQVRRCYRAPRVSTAGRQIVTRVRVRVTPDGTLGGIPMVVFQEGIGPGNQAYADRMARAAIQSVLSCAPLRLPEDVYRGATVVLELTFSPLASA